MGECLEFTGNTGSTGYGCISWGNKTANVHRMVYQLVHGLELPSDVFIRHSCFNRRCCNIAHLSHGSPADNIADTVNAGRHPRGESHGNRKLTEEQVRDIRSSAEKTKVLSERYGITYVTVQRIRSGKAWAHVAQKETDNGQC